METSRGGDGDRPSAGHGCCRAVRHPGVDPPGGSPGAGAAAGSPGAGPARWSSWWRRSTLLLVAGVLLAAGCTGDEQEEAPVTTVQPGAPGQPGRALPGPPGATPQGHSHLDVQFVQGMIAHHAQAVRMSSMVPDRTDREEIRLIARRIGISQEGEIARMTAWLAERGEAATPGPAHHSGSGGLMPGMLSEQQFGQLAGATGPDFDLLFLELMIYHHEGALTMVADLLGNGGGQEAELFEIISHIEADQRIEIDRMRRLLLQLPG